MEIIVISIWIYDNNYTIKSIRYIYLTEYIMLSTLLRCFVCKILNIFMYPLPRFIEQR